MLRFSELTQFEVFHHFPLIRDYWELGENVVQLDPNTKPPNHKILKICSNPSKILQKKCFLLGVNPKGSY